MSTGKPDSGLSYFRQVTVLEVGHVWNESTGFKHLLITRRIIRRREEDILSYAHILQPWGLRAIPNDLVRLNELTALPVKLAKQRLQESSLTCSDFSADNCQAKGKAQ